MGGREEKVEERARELGLGLELEMEMGIVEAIGVCERIRRENRKRIWMGMVLRM